MTDSGNNPDYQLANIDGVLTVYDSTNSADRLRVNSDGHVDVTGNLDVGAGIDVTGSIEATGNVDIDGTLETDALSLNGTAITPTAAEIKIIDGLTSTKAENVATPATLK